MERNGDILTEFNNYCPERYQLNTTNFDLVSSKMCKDDISKSLFCDVPKSLKNNGILSSGLNGLKEDEISIELKKHCLDLLTAEKTNFLKSDDQILPQWNNVVNLYDFSSSNKMSLNTFISKDSFINGKRVLAATETSFQINNCYSSKSAIVSESSLDTSDSTPKFLEESSSSSIEEIFCPIANNPKEAKEQYISRVESQHNLGIVTQQSDSKNQSGQNCSQDKSSLPELLRKESDPICQRKDRAMPELLPTLICLDDDDSIEDFKEEIPAVVSVADSPEMPKLIPFSAEAEEAIRIKTECFANNVLPLSFKKLTPDIKTISCKSSSSTKSKNIGHQTVDLQTCVRKLFPNKEDENVEHFRAKYGKYLSPEKLNEEIGFSFSSSFKDVKDSPSQDTGNTQIKKPTKIQNDESDSEYSESGDEDSDNESGNRSNCKSDSSDSQKSFRDLFETANKAKKKVLSKFDEKLRGAVNSINNIGQPKVMLRRISLDQCSSLHSREKLSSTKNLSSAEKITFEHCLPSNASDDDNSLTSRPECDDSSSNEGPEIEEIEGVRFFQFRSKRDMEEFNKKPMEDGIDLDIIIPTKTTDITQIKGWRNKYFAPDSQCHYIQSDDGNSKEESSQNAKSVPMTVDSTETKCLDFRNCLNDNKTSLQDLKEGLTSDFEIAEDEKVKFDKTPKLETSSAVSSIFVGTKLDDFLINLSTLNVKLLEKENPNIKPIPPDAPILSLGKLRKPDYELKTLAALKRRNMLNKLKEKNQPLKPDYNSDKESVITLSSSDESLSDDDTPVAKLPRGWKRPASSQVENPSLIGSKKRRKSDESVDSSQRLVLRFTKESKGRTDGFKVSDISCEKQNSEDESSSSESSDSSSSSSSSAESEAEELPDIFQKSVDGTSPIIKEAIFLKDSEPKLLEEFLNNLNTLGTSKDVAMLVHSNQSYFSKGPVLQLEMCSEALDALLTTKEFDDSKTKHTPKKKLKAWQKYLPKKLSKTQKQRITKVTCAPKAQSETEISSNLKDKYANKIEKVTNIIKVQPETEKISNLKHEKSPTSRETEMLKKPDHSEEIYKKDKPVTDDVTNVTSNSKPELPILKEVPKIRKRRSRSAIDHSDPFALIERGKRSIRLPARYLDSAVLAAGTEWVSPIFVEDEKKSRKQLLDVLEKTALDEKKAQKQPTDTSEKTSTDEKKTPKPLDSLEKVTPNTPEDKKTRKQLLNVLDKITPIAKNLNSKPDKKSIFPSYEQPTIKKIYANSVLNKPIKRQIKVTNASKKLKIAMEDQTISEASSSQNPNIATIPSSTGDYLLSICSCTPCSRTVSYKKTTKEFVCFSCSQQENKNKSKGDDFKEHTIIENVKSPSSTLKESKTSEIKIINSLTLTSIEESKTQNIPTIVIEDSQSMISNPIKEPEIANITTSPIPNEVHSTISESVKESEIKNNVPSTTSDDLQRLTPKLVTSCDIKNDKPTSDALQPLTPKLVTSCDIKNVKPSIVSETVQSNMSLATKLQIQKLPITLSNSTKSDGATNIVFLLPNNVIQNKIPVLAKESSASSPKGPVFTSESRNIPILSCKPGTESSISSNLLKSSTSNVLQSSPKVLVNPPAVSNAPIVFKYPDNKKSSLPLIYNSQLKPILPGQVLNNSVNLCNVTDKLVPAPVKPNSTQQAASPQMVMTAYKVGGNVYLCQSLRTGNENKSSPKTINPNNTAAILSSSDVVAKENPNSFLTPTKPPSSDLLNSTAKDALDVPSSTLQTPPRKKSRKSPLSARVFKESPDNLKSSKDVSDTEYEVDVDTVDEKFNGKSALRKQLPGYVTDSDASDEECNEIFTTNMRSLIRGGKEKSLKEKKRRLLIKKSFERIKDTDRLFKNARSCKEILDMAVYAVKKFRLKEMALRQAKRMLRLQNAKLLEKLACNLKGVKDIGTRNRLKKQIITAIAQDWANYKNKSADVLSPSQKKTEKKSVNSSAQIEKVEPVAGPAIEMERVVSKQLDFEVEELQNINVPCASQPDVVSKITEEAELPHVQLRILEMPENDQEEIIIMDTEEVEIKIDEAQAPQEKKVKIDEVQPPQEKKVKIDEVQPPQEKKVKIDEVRPPQEKKVKIDEVQPPQEKKVKIIEIRPPQEKKVKIDEVQPSQEKKVKIDKVQPPQEKKVKINEVRPPQEKEVEIKIDEAQPPQEKEVKIDEKQPPQKKEVAIPEREEKEEGELSDSESDDDLLIIDLDMSTPVKNGKLSSQKEKSVPDGKLSQKEKSVPDAKPIKSPPPMREFPGVTPLYPPEFCEKNNPFAIDLSKFPLDSKSVTEDSPKVEPIKKSTAASSSSPITLGDIQSKKNPTKNNVDKLNKFIFETATKQLNALISNSRRKILPKKSPKSNIKPAALSTSPRNSIHRGCKDVKILHGVGDILIEPLEAEGDTSRPERIVPRVTKNPKTVELEEIVIDDSDDEPMEVEDNRGEILQPKEPVAPVIEDITIDDDSQIQTVVS